jgi:hypothetical protein
MMISERASRSISSFTLVFLLAKLSSTPTVKGQQLPCSSDEECHQQVNKLSKCVLSESGDTEGEYYCSNPFESGCFYTLDPEWQNTKPRVCNSEDTIESIQSGKCYTPTDIQYQEVRIFSQNWESVHLEAFLMQIILSEFMMVPTSVETGAPDSYMNFYHPIRRYDSGTTYGSSSLMYSTLYNGDCLEATANNNPQSLWYDPSNDTNDFAPYLQDPSKEFYGINDEGVYIPCAHVITELWDHQAALTLQRQQIIEAPQALGVLGQEGWYVPKFTGRRDPSILSYLGLQDHQGSGNATNTTTATSSTRRKLADMFLRPMKYKDYCLFISKNNCTIPDDVASRPPTSELEDNTYYLKEDQDGIPIFTGYFHPTEENDCILNPTTCTGHIADYPW